ncbi:MAG: lipopolysaccharide biosynthesis protein [Nitrospira sp.]|nr:lipopolysaccharide biosynthesis protein [Nitrospira sp.]
MQAINDSGKIIWQSLQSGLVFFLNYASRFFVAVALAKNLPTEDYGVYSLIGTIIATSTSFLPLGVTQYYEREIPGIESFEKAASIFKSIVAVQMVIISVFLAAVLLVPPLRSILLGSMGLREMSLIVVMIGWLVLAENMASDLGRFLYARKHIEWGNVLSFIQNGVWGGASFAVFLIFPETVSLTFVLFCWGLCLAVAVLYGAWRADIHKILAAPIKIDTYWVALRFGFPLLFSGLLLAADMVGRFFVANVYSTGTLGIYAFHYNIALMIGAISAPLIGNPLNPYIVEAYNIGQVRRSSYLLGIVLKYRLLLAIPMIIIAAVCGEEVVRVLAKADFAAAPGLLYLLIPIPLLMILGNTFERILLLKRKTTKIGQAYVTAAVVQIIATVCLVPFHPYRGVAAAAISGLVVFVLLLWQGSLDADIQAEAHLGRISWVAGISIGISQGVYVMLPPLHPLLTVMAISAVELLSFVMGVVFLGIVSRTEMEAAREAMRARAKAVRSLVTAN